MSLVTMSGELARIDLRAVEYDLVIKTKRGKWVEVGVEGCH